MDLTDPRNLRATRPARPDADRQIGALLMSEGKLTLESVERVLRLQQEKGLRFGEAAVKLGLITQDDLRHVLATQHDYPYLRAPHADISRELTAAYQPFSRQVEQLRALRSSLMLRWFNADNKALAVVSAERKEGRSFLTANLAVVCSQLGQKTLLVDGDLRYPRQHALFGVDNQMGLSSFLSGRTMEEPIKQVPLFVDLSVLPAGPPPPNPLDLLTRPQFGRLLESLAERYDIILVDTPAAEGSADASTVAVRAGGALLVAWRNRSQVRGLQALCSSIVDSGGRIVGTVLNTF